MFLPWAPIQDLDNNRTVRALAQRYGATPRQIVLAWLLARSPSILPIPGTGIQDLEGNVSMDSVTGVAAPSSDFSARARRPARISIPSASSAKIAWPMRSRASWGACTKPYHA